MKMCVMYKGRYVHLCLSGRHVGEQWSQSSQKSQLNIVDSTKKNWVLPTSWFIPCAKCKKFQHLQLLCYLP